jgi:hypothetical protein
LDSKDDDLIRQNQYVALVLQTGLSLEQISKWTSASNDMQVDRDCVRKLRNPAMQSSRRWTKADFLLLQAMVLLKSSGFDLTSVVFDEHKLITHLELPRKHVFAFEVHENSPIDKTMKPSELFGLANAEKDEYVKRAKLIVK